MKKKRIFATAFCLATILALAGCGSSSNSGGSGGTASTADSGSAASTNTAGAADSVETISTISTADSGSDTSTVSAADSGAGAEDVANVISADDKTFNITLAHNMAEDHAVNIALTDWAAAVKEASNGTINIDVAFGGTLGSEADCVSQIQAGQLEMTKVSAGTLANFAAEWNCVSVPYVFNDKDHLYSVMNGEIGQDLYKLTEGDGFLGLSWLESGTRCFYTAETPVRTPDDLKGLKIRTMDSQMAIDMMDAFGGSAAVLSYGDIYTGMQQGVVNGAENNITALRDHADVTKYYCYDEHTMIPDVIVISDKIWNEMSDAQREVMTRTAADMVDNYKELWAQFEEEVKAQVEGKVEYITDVDKAAFQEAVEPLYEKLKSDDPDTYAFVERIQAAG